MGGKNTGIPTSAAAHSKPRFDLFNQTPKSHPITLPPRNPPLYRTAHLRGHSSDQTGYLVNTSVAIKTEKQKHKTAVPSKRRGTSRGFHQPFSGCPTRGPSRPHPPSPRSRWPCKRTRTSPGPRANPGRPPNQASSSTPASVGRGVGSGGGWGGGGGALMSCIAVS